MAYNRQTLLHIGGVSPLPQTWEIFTSDTVTGAGYVPKTEGVRDGDHVTKVDITRNSTTGLITAYNRTEYYAVANATGVLTLTAI